MPRNARIERVTPDDVATMVERLLDGEPRTLAVVGPHHASEFA